MDFNKVIQELENSMIPTEIVEPVNKSENLKEKLLKTLWKEVELLNERKDLTLKSSLKTIGGNQIEKYENRGWKFLPDGKILITPYVKGTIVKLFPNEKRKLFSMGNEFGDVVNTMSILSGIIEKNYTNESLLELNKGSKVLSKLK
ncbi:MAG: hypothetical protein ACON4E_04400 [Flavobacteriales bacterium]|jgi:hypothetical protein